FISWKNEYNSKQSQKTNKLNEQERRLIQKEENLDNRYLSLDNREKENKKKENDNILKEEELEALRTNLNDHISEAKDKLEKISGMTKQEAKDSIIKEMESEARLDSAKILRIIEEEYKEKSSMMGKEIISTAIQRIGTEHVMSSAVTVIDLPNDEMKGRIIGREGRNIRALETATEVDFIVDDTPEAIIVSSFDPVRREIAKRVLESLIADGRIHPARIEEVVEKEKINFNSYLKEVGENAVMEIGIPDINPELFLYLGKLKYRTSYGQNVLQHSKEVAMVAAYMAAELGVNANEAKRAGLLHDIGKSIDRETEGTHTKLSVDLVKKYGESKKVQEAIASHHMDVDFTSIEGVLVQSADAISAARPGARREMFESYIKRLQELEELSVGFEGVDKAYALRAGREVRVIIDSNETDDNKTFMISKNIAKKIQEDMEYPGQIKVTVIREIRATEYAK
ncbi:MAG: ribonuclease Y, partial [Candidatus Aminicenantes bacterium]|nr:ribonuclease Y [Candidatus Aminicenantes bacterium]